ncbi:carbohydrate binding domain-containing protein [Paenibacillus sp. GCM10012307]|uniref:CBM-cenC domain-containing protein n=1 Tax=Paenibacillus roseus TaxID=2798579 RepID=A0A934J717_9BACL|nr:carbohydrate binding domain-containing protein [Paenibacillus roseus]MBJ6361567.1 hypothetical protein [Paenibacillus roseus]
MKYLLFTKFAIIFVLCWFNAASVANGQQYTYDDAERIVTATDSSGRSIHYNVDSMGNIKESSPVPSPNLLKNGDFKTNTGSTGVADYWHTFVSQANITTDFQVVSASATNAQKISAAQLEQWDNVILHQTVALKAETFYEFKGNIHIVSLQRAQVVLTIEFTNASGVQVEEIKQVYPSVTNGVKAFSRQGLVPSGSTHAKVSIYIQGTAQNGSGTLRVNQLSFTHPQFINILNNGSFDHNNQSDVADGWSTYVSNGAGPVSFEIVSSPVVAGKFAQKIKATRLGQWDNAMIQQTQLVNREPFYELSGYISVASLQNARVLLSAEFLDQSGVRIKEDQQEFKKTTGGYVMAALQGEIPSNAATVKTSVYIQGMQQNSSGAIYLDAFQFGYKKQLNALANGSFEYEGNVRGVAESWHSYVTPGKGTGRFELTGTSASSASGRKAQKITAAQLGKWENVIIEQTVNVQSGQQYQLTGLMNILSLKQARVLLNIEFLNANGGKVGEKQLEYKAASNGMSPISVHGQFPTGTSKVKLSIQIQSTGTNGAATIILDHFAYQIR